MRRTLLLFGLFVFCFMAAGAQGKVVVRITNFRSNKGVCLIGLYNNAQAFAGKGNAVEHLRIPIVNLTAETTIENLPGGTYAVSVVHDANDNNRFDTNFIGIPTEGYGASQNKLPFAAAPKFDANKFVVAADGTTVVNIKLRYLF